MQQHYSPDIQVIIVSGDIAVVRLIWTLTLRNAAQKQTRQEADMDVLRRQPDGRWAPHRFMAFDTKRGSGAPRLPSASASASASGPVRVP